MFEFVENTDTDSTPRKKIKLKLLLFFQTQETNYCFGYCVFRNKKMYWIMIWTPWEWWKRHMPPHYPTMTNLTRKFWYMPAISVPSELFSLAGNVLSQRRNRLLQQNVDSLVFLRNSDTD